MFLLDTNTIIYFFKGIGNVPRILLSKSPNEIAIPSIALYELGVGIAKSNNPRRRKQQLGEFVAQITILPFGEEEAWVAAGIRAELEKQGTPMGPHDTLIAGIALHKGCTLVTHNTKEFMRIKSLNIEDWF